MKYVWRIILCLLIVALLFLAVGVVLFLILTFQLVELIFFWVFVITIVSILVWVVYDAIWKK